MKKETTAYCTQKPLENVDLQKSRYREMEKDIKKLFADIILFRKQEGIKSYTDFAKIVDLSLPISCIYSNEKDTKVFFSKCKPNQEGKSTWNMGNEKYNILRMFLDKHLNSQQQ